MFKVTEKQSQIKDMLNLIEDTKFMIEDIKKKLNS